ncbi:MAG: hypothetical protein KBT08_09020 [Bacteroidales bacterium]|nr:hypothetical protein [Candidatus Cryptobacteroides onthequi]
MDTTLYGGYVERNQYVDRKAVEKMTKEASKIINEQLKKSPIIEPKQQQAK